VVLMRRSTSLVLALALAAVLGGCTAGSEPEPTTVLFAVPTQPEPAPGVQVACMDALATGVLVADSRWGIALGQTDAPTMQVIWPGRFSGRQSNGVIELLDASGAVVGRVGEIVSIGGGMGAGDAWWACGAPNRN
jgi:hypothetical protein